MLGIPARLNRLSVSGRSLTNRFSTKLRASLYNQSSTAIEQRTPCDLASQRHFSVIRVSNIIERNKAYTRTTKVLLSISTSFLILHCPIAVCKLYSFFKTYRGLTENIDHVYLNETSLSSSLSSSSSVAFLRTLILNVTSDDDEKTAFSLFNSSSKSFLERRQALYLESVLIEHLIERVSNDLYYLYFLLNFFLYSMNGANFRKNLVSMFRKVKFFKTKR